MKLTIITVLLALSLFNTADAFYYGLWGYYPWWGSYWYGKRDNVQKTERTECTYNKEASMLVCLGKSGKSECEAFMKLPSDVNYDLYAIETLDEAPMKFHIIPRKQDNTAWLQHWITEDGAKKFFTLYQSNKFVDYGLQVKDAECFRKTVELLKKSPRHETIFFESELKDKPESTKIIADLTVFEKLPGKNKEKSKRWWYGLYGWGYPIWGFGLWGKRDITEEAPINDARDVSDMKHELDYLRRETEAGFEIYEENTGALVKEVQKLKREVQMMKMHAINTETSFKTKRNEPMLKLSKKPVF